PTVVLDAKAPIYLCSVDWEEVVILADDIDLIRISLVEILRNPLWRPLALSVIAHGHLHPQLFPRFAGSKRGLTRRRYCHGAILGLIRYFSEHRPKQEQPFVHHCRD